MPTVNNTYNDRDVSRLWIWNPATPANAASPSIATDLQAGGATDISCFVVDNSGFTTTTQYEDVPSHNNYR